MFNFKKKSVHSKIKEVILKFNGEVYYALDSKGNYLVSNALVYQAMG